MFDTPPRSRERIRARSLTLQALFFVSAITAPVSAQVVGVPLRIVAVAGDASPDGDGSFGQLGVPSINDLGHISFGAVLTGSLSAQGLFVERTTGLDAVARVGDPVPDGNGSFAGFGLEPIPIDAFGEVAFQSGILGSAGGSADNVGVFISGQPTRQVVRKGQTVPGGNGSFDSFDSVGISDLGSASFWAQLSGTNGGPFVDDRGVYSGAGGVGKVAAVEEILRMGELEIANGPSRFGNVDPSLASDRSGWVAIRVFLSDDTDPSVNDLAVFLHDGIGADRVFTSGDPAPDGNGDLFDFPLPFVGADGRVASHVTFANSSGGLADNMGLVSYPTTGAGQVLAREGDAAPVEGSFAVDFLDALGFASTINAQNRMVFHAFLNGTSGGSLDDTGLFLSTPQSVVEVVRQGDATPEPDGEFDEFRFNLAHVNPAGCVLFFADVRNATRGAGVFRRDSNGNLATVARIGQPMLGSSIQNLTIADEDSARLAGVSPMNAFCQVALRLRLMDGRQLIVATVPEPSEVAAATLALAMLGALRGCARRGAAEASSPLPRQE